ncbi:MAG: TIGR00725 family protein [Deltaproteobacteria bacterium]|nr:TIGR00725 family protein [Deltaproteobacteria bacterium]
MQIGIIGAGECTPEVEKVAEEVGRQVARCGAVLICGGMGGVMRAACRGAAGAGGITVGILPGNRAEQANEYVQIRIVTDMGHARNVLVVHSSDVLIAIAGEYGTLSELAIALKLGKPVVGLETWDISPDIVNASDPAEAVEKAALLVRRP